MCPGSRAHVSGLSVEGLKSGEPGSALLLSHEIAENGVVHLLETVFLNFVKSVRVELLFPFNNMN